MRTMNIIIFGATGMVGQGALREALLDPAVTRVVTVGRSTTGQQHPKLREIVHANLFDLSLIAHQLTGLDGCLFCLGVSSAGMTEADYQRVTHDLTLSVAQTLVTRNPQMTFVYVSGAGTDSSERGGSMWARVKGATENALFKMPFKAAYMFRPGFIQPLHGIVSKTLLYRAIYVITKPIYPLLARFASNYITTTEVVGKAMVRVVREGASERVIEQREINGLGGGRQSTI